MRRVPTGDISDSRRQGLGRRIAVGSTISLAGVIVANGAGIVVAGTLARLLNAEDFGAFLVANSATTVLVVIARFGLGQTAVRRIAAARAIDRDDEARAAAIAVAALTVVTAVAMGVVVGSPLGRWAAHALVDSPSLAGATFALAVWTIVDTVRLNLAEIHRGFGRISAATIYSQTARYVAMAAACSWFLAARHHLRLSTACWAMAGTGLAVLAVAATDAIVVVGRRPRGGHARARRLLIDGGPVMLWDLSGLLLTQVDLYAVSAILGGVAAARYGSASRVALLLALPLGALNLALPPIITELYARDDKERLEAVLRSTAAAATAVAAVVTLGAILAGGLALRLVFGAGYQQGGTVLVILAVGQLGSVACGSCGLTLVMSGHQREAAITAMVALVLGTPLVILGARTNGIEGAALVAAGVNIVYNLALARAALVKVGVHTYPSFATLGQLGSGWRARRSR